MHMHKHVSWDIYLLPLLSPSHWHMTINFCCISHWIVFKVDLICPSGCLMHCLPSSLSLNCLSQGSACVCSWWGPMSTLLIYKTDKMLSWVVLYCSTLHALKVFSSEVVFFICASIIVGLEQAKVQHLWKSAYSISGGELGEKADATHICSLCQFYVCCTVLLYWCPSNNKVAWILPIEANLCFTSQQNRGNRKVTAKPFLA